MKPGSMTFMLALLCASAAVPALDHQAMALAMEKAQAEASKPGDEKLSCEQLQDQLVTVTQDPAFQSYFEAAGADAQKKQEAMKAAEGRIAVERFRTIMMAVMPGAAMPGMAGCSPKAPPASACSDSRGNARPLASAGPPRAAE